MDIDRALLVLGPRSGNPRNEELEEFEQCLVKEVVTS